MGKEEAWSEVRREGFLKMVLRRVAKRVGEIEGLLKAALGEYESIRTHPCHILAQRTSLASL